MKLAHAFAAALTLVLAAPALAQAPQETTGVSTPNYREIDDIPVVNAEGKKVGEVEQALVNGSGISAVVIEIDRFLGIGEKEVVIPLDKLRFETDRFSTTLSDEELKGLPEWDD